MDSGNKIVNVLLMSVIGVLVVASLIFCVSVGVNTALIPVKDSMTNMSLMQREMDRKINDSQKAEIRALTDRIAALEAEVKTLKDRPSVAAAPQPPMPPSEDFNKVYDLPVAGSYVEGKADAKLTIVEFSDIQCPFCAKFHPVIQDVLKAFPNDVKLVFKNYPLMFHQNARPAAKAALAAGLQGKFYEMLTLLMANNQDLTEEKYKALAKQLGLNVDKFVKDLKEKDAEFEKRIADDMALGDTSDVRGTPTYFLNGKKTMARDLAAWKSQIEDLLKK